MTDAPEADTPDYEPMFVALCTELGLCLHAKGQARVVAALPDGLDAAVKAVFAAGGIDFLNAPGSLKRDVRDCLKVNSPAG
jgi:hypothetical protein